MYSNNQRVAIIDLGSNSARVIVMSFEPGRSYHLEDEIREVVRLREGMTAAGLSEAATTRALFTLRLFRHFCDSIGTDHIIATATSAVREAANGPQFLEQVERETGLKLRILKGEEEAYYGAIGVLNAVPITEGVILDIGGGSAQLSQVQGRRFQQGQALTLGALALTERFVSTDPISNSEWKAIRREIARQLDGVAWLDGAQGPLVGLGGTIRNLAKIEAARQSYPLNSVNGFRLSRDSVARSLELLRLLSLAERKLIPGLKSDRADIILPGAMVLSQVMERLGVDEITISQNGLREGLFFEEFWQGQPYPVVADVRGFSVENMARFYSVQERHAKHVGFLAGRLFDQLQPLHGYGPIEREWLAAAALLHDLGTVINYYDHHKYSEALIAGAGLPGFSPREVALIALLTRFHRKGTPTSNPYTSLLEEGDEERLTKLSAMLRLSEFLERGKNGLVRDVEVAWDDALLCLTLVSDEYPAVELWDTQRNAATLTEAAFGRAVMLYTTAEAKM